MNKIFFFILLFFLNCFSDLPLKLELTQEPTALEKQIIGEDKELEKDGWLISSIKTSSLGTEDWKKDISSYNEIGFRDKDYKEVLNIIFYLSSELKDYKSKHVVGEGLNGFVQIINKQEAKKEFESLEKKERVKKVVQLINDARVRIFETRVLSISKTISNTEELNKAKEKILLEFYNTVEPGEYYELTKGIWLKK